MKNKTLEEVCEENSGLVYNEVAKTGRFDMLEDLAQEGFIGLIKAWESFDENRGYKFSTYAVPTIRGFILSSLKNFDNRVMVRIPEYLYAKGLAGEKMVFVGSSDDILINTKRSEKSNTKLIDTLADENSYKDLDEHIILFQALKWLNERDSRVIFLRYFHKLSLQEIGDELGISKERVRQLLIIIEKRLKRYITRNK